MHYYTFNIGNYRRDTQHLSTLEHGIYRLLLDQYYLTEKPINENALRLLCIRSTEEIRIAENLLKEFFQEIAEGEFIHKGCDKVIGKFKEKSEKAKTSAKTRWDANAMRTHSEGNANQEPITNNQEPINTHVTGKPDDNCPHEEIIKIYHAVLPELPSVKIWNDKRQKLLKARWREDEKRQNLDWWTKFFRYVSKSDFLMGRANGFQASLEWLINSSNFVKVVEGNYENRKNG